MQSAIDVEETLDRIAERDPRFHRDAYYFVRDALDVAQKKFCRSGRDPQHVSGQQLLDGIREHAVGEFGPMGAMVLGEWGVTKCEDFGDIVFNMVEESLLGKTDEDTREDFKGGYDFEDAFVKPYRPKGTLKKKKRAPKADPSTEQSKN
jgi:uncharacterized repeat protein (TIGR04138 family)